MKFESFVGVRLPKELVNFLRMTNISISDFIRDALYDKIMHMATNDEYAMKYIESVISNELKTKENNLSQLEVKKSLIRTEIEKRKSKIEHLKAEIRQLEVEIDKLNLEHKYIDSEIEKLKAEIETLKERLGKLEEYKEHIKKFRDSIDSEIEKLVGEIVNRMGEFDPQHFRDVLNVRIGVISERFGISKQMVKDILSDKYPVLKDVLDEGVVEG